MAIITISREMGSAGIPIAHKAAEKLGYTLVDGEAIRKVAPDYGLTPEALEKADEKPPAFVEKLDEQIEVDLHQIELIVLEYALKGNVIIYGRGGQDLLKGVSHIFRVRIIAPFEERVERWAEREWLDPDLARTLVRKSDQQRAGFIKYYFDRDWADPLHYDLIINTSRINEDTAVKLICDGVKDPNLVEQKGASKKVLADLIIRKKAEIAILSSHDLDGHHLEIKVKDGVVTLSGHIHGQDEHDAAINLVKGLEGVKKINDQLRVIEYRNYPREH
ncbi:transporter [Desulfuromonas versatilis]|uniref:Transporter n=1 Tax=Desulfuromonas versatilis TaxID=2802975 RepID=A0ABN6DVP4_9BACT|nr:cytidylate kinase family protein [Desulfuromonas versatilis]BCR04193.1 transporter [Desulfuromonas versatilis]